MQEIIPAAFGLLTLANSICQRGSKTIAERVSQRALPDFKGMEYLFLCLNRP